MWPTFLFFVFSVLLSASSSEFFQRTRIRGTSLRISPPGSIQAREALQDMVTWDENSLFVRGERIMVFSAEFHPFRLPVPSLWVNVLDKIKALGFNTVSFYINWAFLEGSPGTFKAEGVFDWDRFCQMAKEKGVWLIAVGRKFFSHMQVVYASQRTFISNSLFRN